MDISVIDASADPNKLRELAARLDKLVPMVVNDLSAVDTLRDASRELVEIAERAEAASDMFEEVVAAPLREAITRAVGGEPTPGCDCPMCRHLRAAQERASTGKGLN